MKSKLLTHTPSRRSNAHRYLALLFTLSAVLLFCPWSSAYADSCSAPSKTYGTDSLQVPVQTAGTYTIWVRTSLPSKAGAAELLNINGGAHCYNIGTSTAHSWTWVDYSDNNAKSLMQVPLRQGKNTFLFTGLIAGTKIDRVEALAQTSCKPTGTGNNCATASAGSAASSGGSQTAGGSSSASAGGGTDTGTAGTTASNGDIQLSSPYVFQPSQQAGVQKVEYFLDNKLVATKTAAPYSYTVNPKTLLNGTHKLTIKTYYASGTVTTTSKNIMIKNSALVEARLLAQKFLWVEALVIAGAAAGVWYYLRRRSGSTAADPALQDDAYAVPDQPVTVMPDAAPPSTVYEPQNGTLTGQNDTLSGQEQEHDQPQTLPPQENAPTDDNSRPNLSGS